MILQKWQLLKAVNKMDGIEKGSGIILKIAPPSFWLLETGWIEHIIYLIAEGSAQSRVRGGLNGPSPMPHFNIIKFTEAHSPPVLIWSH